MSAATASGAASSALQRVSFDELFATFKVALTRAGFSDEQSTRCARIFAENTRDGIHSHGVNRFPGFVDLIRRGLVDVTAVPEAIWRFGAFERWDGNHGAGVLNASFSMGRAIELARAHGIGCVALRNTNHWMRAGTYGLQAADAGCLGICWTNTQPLMPPWGGKDAKLGNNPIVLCVPSTKGHVLLDIAMSQFSLGRLLITEKTGARLPVPGGFDEHGNLTDEPGAILRSRRPLPIGYWKGSGLALLLDCFASLLSLGRATCEIDRDPVESGMSQCFIAIDLAKAGCLGEDEIIVGRILDDLRSATPAVAGKPVRVPGEGVAAKRRASESEGIWIASDLWQKVKEL